ncbi:MAG: hypothetical protein JNL83_38590 [Myxococcales bacterium]|nr:hypothetical protein [Myxococcales bacterium]
MTDDTLRDLGKQLPTDRPDAARTDKVRASLLAAAAAPAARPSRRWLLVGGGFAAGALAAAAAVTLLVRSGDESAVAPAHEAYAHVESSSAAQLEHTMVPSATGTDEVVRVKAGTVRLAVPPTRAGDRVRVATGDAELEGSGAYEVVVEADRLAAVTVTSGTATLRLAGQQQAVFLAAGQTWRATVQTAELAIAPDPTPSQPPPPSPDPSRPPNPNAGADSGAERAPSIQATPRLPTPSPGVGSGAERAPASQTATRPPPPTPGADSGAERAASIQTTPRPPTPSPGVGPGAERAASIQTTPQAPTPNPGVGSGAERAASLQTPPRPPPPSPGVGPGAPRPPTTPGADSGAERTPSRIADVDAPASGTRPGNGARPAVPGSRRTSATASGAPTETELTPDVPPAPAPAISVAKPVAPAVDPVTETERHFRAGAAALRANRLAEAAAELAAAAAGEGPLAVDGRYYQAVALIRAKRGAEAERALVQFLDKAPASSTRRGRAAVMLAKLIADRGDAAGARGWYELAAKDPDPAVSAAAKAALR